MILKETDTLAGGTAIPKMAEKHGVSAARPRIRYVIQLGAIALVKMADPAAWWTARTPISSSPQPRPPRFQPFPALGTRKAPRSAPVGGPGRNEAGKTYQFSL